MIHNDQSDIYKGLSEDHNCYYESCEYSESGYGRPKGGLAILFNKKFPFERVPISKNLLGIKCVTAIGILLIINVYMPCDKYDIDSTCEFLESLGKLSDILQNENYNQTCLIGDFNTDPNKGRFFKHLKAFANQNELLIADIAILPHESFTFLSAAHDTCSWLDHIVTSNADFVKNISILYDSEIVDHFPIKCELCIDIVERDLSNTNGKIIKKQIKWDSLNDADKLMYQQATDQQFCELLEHDLFMCQEATCNFVQHKECIEYIYSYAISIMLNASTPFIKEINTYNFTPVPGFNKYCLSKRQLARVCFLEWSRQGRPRSGATFDEMKESRKIFTQSVKFCKKNKESIVNNLIMNKITQNDKRDFWREIKNHKNNKTYDPDHIDGYYEPIDIANHFKGIYI